MADMMNLRGAFAAHQIRLGRNPIAWNGVDNNVLRHGAHAAERVLLISALRPRRQLAPPNKLMRG